MRNTHCRTLIMARNQKRGKGDTHVVGHGIWQETLKNVDNEKWPNQDIKYAKNPEKCGKFRNVQCRIWNMARKLEIMKKRETST